MTEGPALYLNGTPDAGGKMALSTEVMHSKMGKFASGEVSRDLTNRKPACRKSKVGPDPYNIHVSNPWHQRSSKMAFRPGPGEERVHRTPRPVCARSLNFDPYSVNTRDNAWGSLGRTSSPRASTSQGSRGGSSPTRAFGSSARVTAASSAYYFSPFPESLGAGSRAHTPRTPQGFSPTAEAGFMTLPTLTGAKAWDAVAFGSLGSPGSPGAASLPPLPVACRLPMA